jgi:hypothetical protein
MQDKMNKISPFMGWHPYTVYDCKWEKKRMEKARAKTHGPEGTLVAHLPENARFHTDPFDDGLYERWQDLPADTPKWKNMKISSGWDAQELHDEKGRPYKGIAWYKFDIKVPADTQRNNVFLYGLAVVNEAWVWINGRYAGHRPYNMPWFRPHSIELDVSRLLKPGKRTALLSGSCVTSMSLVPMVSTSRCSSTQRNLRGKANWLQRLSSKDHLYPVSTIPD